MTLSAANLDATLAVLTEASYRQDASLVAGLETAGFVQLDLEGDGNGTATSGSAAFDAWTTVAGTQTVAIIAFRGTDDFDTSKDGLSAYQASDDAAYWFDTVGYYDQLSGQVAAFDAAVDSLGISQVYVTGHSLGGAAAQAYMAEHQNDADTSYTAVVFGSMGLSGSDGSFPTDARIVAFAAPSDYSAEIGTQTAGLTISFSGATGSLDTGLDLSALLADPASFLDVHGTDLYLDAAATYDAARAGIPSTETTTFFTSTVSLGGLNLTVSPL
jgi:pimeloyl-ACP methyl ester carboxylesterase